MLFANGSLYQKKEKIPIILTVFEREIVANMVASSKSEKFEFHPRVTDCNLQLRVTVVVVKVRLRVLRKGNSGNMPSLAGLSIPKLFGFVLTDLTLDFECFKTDVVASKMNIRLTLVSPRNTAKKRETDLSIQCFPVIPSARSATEHPID